MISDHGEIFICADFTTSSSCSHENAVLRKTALFEKCIFVSCASYIAILLLMDVFVVFCLVNIH